METKVGYAKKKKKEKGGICKIETDKVMMVGENVLSSPLRDINNDTASGESVYGNSATQE